MWSDIVLYWQQLCLVFVSGAVLGCSGIDTRDFAELPLTEWPRVAIVPIGLTVQITTLSTVKTVNDEHSPEGEAREIAAAVHTIEEEARWILQSRLATRYKFRFVPFSEIEHAVAELGLVPGALPTSDQVILLGKRLNADLVVVATIEDYGKVRWQWLLAGMLTDMTVDNLIIGLATSWNPVALSASIGWDVLTSAPVWFGGGYVFGVAFRPVRVQARAYETRQGHPIWQAMEAAAYAWGKLKQLPEIERKKKEHQLWINLDTAMEALADSLAAERFRVSRLPVNGQALPCLGASAPQAVGGTC